MATLPVSTDPLDLAGWEVVSDTDVPFDDTMSDDELVSHLSAHEANAIGYFEDVIADEQATAIDYYYRRMPDLPAQEGCSSVVDGTVAIVIDNALSSILKPFVSSDETVSFAPRGPEDVEIADQATEYCNYVFNYDNPGFTILHNWFKDALLTKIGIVKCWWEESERIEREQVIVNNELALAQVRMSPDYETEEPQPDGTILVSMAKVITDGRVKIENIPPEEWMINPYARSLKDASYIAHCPKNMTRSALLEMGFSADVVETLPGSRDFSNAADSSRSNSRYRDEGSGGSDFRLGTPHESQELVDIRDEYVRIDYDGDGIAELRRIIRAGDTVLMNEEVEHLPFAILCPVPMPHKVIGLSLADQVVDLQRISTVIWRQTLDNLYKTNNPRPVVGEGAERADGSTPDSIGDNAPGAAVLVKDPSQMRYDSVPFFARESFGMLEYVEGQQEARTGIGRAGQGLDPDAIRKSGQMTATEVSIMNQGRNARAEMIARIFAETGVKDLFKLILQLLVEYQPRERMVKLRNKWVEVDPSGWPTDMDVEISVGLGMGDKTEQMAVAGTMLEDFAMLAQSQYSGLIDANKVYAALKHKYNAAGIKNIDDYLIEPQEGQQQEQQPDPEAMKAQADMQMQQAKMQGEQQLAQMRLEMQREEAAQQQQLAREKAEFEAQLARDKAQFEAELAEQKLVMEQQFAERRMQMSERQAMSQNRPGGDLDK